MRLSVVFAASFLIALAACSSDSDDDPTDTGDSGGEADVAADGSGTGADAADAAEGDLTWSNDIRQIAEDSCVPCHRAGGAAPFTLDSHSQWQLYGLAAIAAIDAGRMPPWSPNPDCQHYEDERLLDPADLADLRAWVDAGMPVGDPDLAVIETDDTIAEFDSTHGGTVPPYTPSFESADDYRCFVLDLDVPETVYMTASRVVPGNELVHHALVYALTGDQAATALDLDAMDETPGYTCFGGPIPLAADDGSESDPLAALSAFTGFPTQIGGWVPGSTINESPAGLATRIGAGSIVVIQIHYSAVAGPAREDGATRFEMRATTDAPDRLRVTSPVVIQELDIPAGEAVVEHSVELPYYGLDPLTLRAVAGHMHLLGTEITGQIRPDAADEICLFDIPEWDFNWQQQYVLAEDDWITVDSGSPVRVTCTYDNSAANQPVVNGEQIEPRDVVWGDGTLDEMCILYLESVFPFTPEEPDTGGAACTQSCVDTCGTDPSIECLLRCSGDNLACIGCAFEELSTCGAAACVSPLVVEQPACLQTCFTAAIMLQGDTALCLAAECPDVFSELSTCIDPFLATEGCSEQRATCGLTW